MKKIITTLVIAVLFVVVPTTASANHLSTSERRQVIAEFVRTLREFNTPYIDAQTRSFLVRQLFENLTQTLGNHQSDNDYESRDDDDEDRDYNNAEDSVSDYLEDRYNYDYDEYEITETRRNGSGYRIEVEADDGYEYVFYLSSRYTVNEVRRTYENDNRNDNSDSPYVDDDTRVGRDYIEFRIAFDLEADRDDIYISSDLEDVLEFVIESDNGDVVADEGDLGRSWLSGYISSTAEADDGYYLIPEDESEEFEFIIRYEPNDNDEYRLELDRLGYNNDDRPADDYLNFKNGRYVTNYYSIDN